MKVVNDSDLKVADYANCRLEICKDDFLGSKPCRRPGRLVGADQVDLFDVDQVDSVNADQTVPLTVTTRPCSF